MFYVNAFKCNITECHCEKWQQYCSLQVTKKDIKWKLRRRLYVIPHRNPLDITGRHWIDWSRLNPATVRCRICCSSRTEHLFLLELNAEAPNKYTWSPFSGLSPYSALISWLITLFVATRTHCDWTEPEPLYHYTIMRTNTRALHAVRTHTLPNNPTNVIICQKCEPKRLYEILMSILLYGKKND